MGLHLWYPFDLMDPSHMLIVITPMRESLPAVFALKRFFTSVGPQVLVEISFLCETHRAVMAGVWLYTGMHKEMAAKTMPLAEFSVAHVAAQRLEGFTSENRNSSLIRSRAIWWSITPRSYICTEN
mmetsp:Transcript_20937/g.40513  ORF Transcript_20937/g.40513 Transcript_20937/m.40513 type:complete len:126 (-) Transcript_20937:250-627(-)